MSEKFNWDSATKAEIYAHKEANYNASKKLEPVLKNLDKVIKIPPYIDEENDVYRGGGYVYLAPNGVIGFIDNHLSMKQNLQITWFNDEPMEHGEWSQKEFILSQLKSIAKDIVTSDEPVETYSVTPELTDEESMNIALGTVASNAYDQEVEVFTGSLFDTELLVHFIEGKVYFIEELSEEDADSQEQL